MANEIIIKGAREHNLKNVNLTLPRDKFIVITGVSGSGKSSLAFDTLFAEGQRRYLESLSSYARQFLGQMEKPDVDYIEGLSPAISIDQKSTSHNPRSTVGTVTEIHDYLRLLYAKIGIPHCPARLPGGQECGREITKLSTDEIVDRILDLESNKTSAEILSPVIRDRKGDYSTLLSNLFKKGFTRAYINGKREFSINAKRTKLARYKKHTIDVVVDTIQINSNNISRIFESTEKALKLSEGLVKVRKLNAKEEPIKSSEKIYNQKLSCPTHEIEFPPLEPRLFSFNSPYGACPACEGLGSKKEIDPSLVMPDKTRTIAQGGLIPWSYKKNNYQGTVLHSVCQHYHISENTRLQDLPPSKLDILLNGDPDEGEPVRVRYHFKSGSGYFNIYWRGLIKMLEDRYQKTDSEAVRKDIEKYMSKNPCSACNGSRYKSEVLMVTVGKKNIHEVSSSSIVDTISFFESLKLDEREEKIAGKILKEIRNRLHFLENVGLGYLTLSRTALTLSGGEAQRIRLASQVGSGLVGVLYILDEPSIGLHARDNKRLLETLTSLRELGNTIIVIEHDEETMRTADYLVDIGPGAGAAGGQIVAEGAPEKVVKNKDSLTGKYLRGDLEIETPEARRTTKNKRFLRIEGASEHNLKNITVDFPLKVFTVVTGVSGSGKSTLVEEILYKSLSSQIMRSLEKPGRFKEMKGAQNISKVVMVDQSPIGRTPRSNPATYTGIFTPIRKLFATTKEARKHGYSPGRFSFNVPGGRCDNCDGQGFLKIEMQFMPDVYLPCDVCKEKRYNRETLRVTYKNKNIADILDMSVTEALKFFEDSNDICSKLQVLEDVGLGYIKLGQAATTLSGGEAQRIKLASELSQVNIIRNQNLKTGAMYILDEPTTGLHFDDIKKLLNVLNRLVETGNTVVVIEHNMDVIKTADWIVDLGPEGGDEGGRVIVAGTPEEVVKYHKESYTGKFLKEVLEK